jgi:hypothetical protein
VAFALKHEYAQHPMDILARRTRLSFVDLMGTSLRWSSSQKAQAIASGKAYLKSSMGMGVAGFGPVEKNELVKGVMGLSKIPVERSGGGV